MTGRPVVISEFEVEERTCDDSDRAMHIARRWVLKLVGAEPALHHTRVVTQDARSGDLTCSACDFNCLHIAAIEQLLDQDSQPAGSRC